MVYVFAAWTVFVWVTRIRNIIGDGGAEGISGAVDVAVAAGLVVLGLLVALAGWRGRPAWAVPALGVATVAVWAVRVPMIVLSDEWSVGFEVVHAGLAVVSVALAALAWRSWRRRRVAGSVPALSGR